MHTTAWNEKIAHSGIFYCINILFFSFASKYVLATHSRQLKCIFIAFRNTIHQCTTSNKFVLVSCARVRGSFFCAPGHVIRGGLSKQHCEICFAQLPGNDRHISGYVAAIAIACVVIFNERKQMKKKKRLSWWKLQNVRPNFCVCSSLQLDLY